MAQSDKNQRIGELRKLIAARAAEEEKLRAQLSEVRGAISQLGGELMALTADFKVGELVFYEGKRMRITRIKPGYGGFEHRHGYMAVLVKKDGSDGATERELWHRNAITTIDPNGG